MCSSLVGGIGGIRLATAPWCPTVAIDGVLSWRDRGDAHMFGLGAGYIRVEFVSIIKQGGDNGGISHRVFGA